MGEAALRAEMLRGNCVDVLPGLAPGISGP